MSGVVPTLDLDSHDLSSLLDETCRRVGFAVIGGHRVPAQVITDAWHAATTFFDLPLELKMQIAMPSPGYPYGYSPVAGETLAASLGRRARPDLKESLAIGPTYPPTHELDADEAFAWSANLWPSAVPHLRPAFERYYHEMSQLAARLLRAMALALGLPDTHFDQLIDRHTSALRAVRYPGGEARPDDLGASAHTDYGTLTVLLADPDVGGLQVCDELGEWHDVEAPRGTFVVNLGDAMARWTNDRWRSTLHRVLVPSRPRQSIAFFHNAN